MKPLTGRGRNLLWGLVVLAGWSLMVWTSLRAACREGEAVRYRRIVAHGCERQAWCFRRLRVPRQ